MPLTPPGMGWAGSTVAIMASGPSLTEGQCATVRGRCNAIAINSTWMRAPWADVLYACDWRWWGWGAPSAEEFAGRRLMHDQPADLVAALAGENAPRADHCAMVERVAVESMTDAMIWDRPAIGSGGSSAFQAVNLAARWGARRILLLGVDHHSPGAHWHGPHRHPRPARQTDATQARWRAAWRTAAPDLAARGVDVLNCTPGSELDAFPAADLARALDGEARHGD